MESRAIHGSRLSQNASLFLINSNSNFDGKQNTKHKKIRKFCLKKADSHETGENFTFKKMNKKQQLFNYVSIY